MPYDEMPDIYARASCMVLASIPRAFSGPGLGDSLRNYWESVRHGARRGDGGRRPILAAASGAIPEVTHNAVPLFPPGDWQELARSQAVR